MRRHGSTRCGGRSIFSSSNSPIALAPESSRAYGSWTARWSCRRWKVRFQKLPSRLSGSSTASCPTSTLRICSPRSMVGPGSPTSSRICAGATWCAIAPPFLPPCWPTPPISAPSAWRKASSNVSERQIGWARLFHVRPETYKAAQAAITDAHSAHPHAALWGAGATSSSDGQFFRASDRAAGRSDVNLHYGSEPGTKFYSHLSDQYGYFSILPISPSESEAPYVLDGLFDHESKLDIDEHYTDTGGSSDHVFGLFALLGRRFAPRLRNLKDRKFHAFEEPDAYPALKAHLGPRINIDLIRDNWDELLRMAASMNERIVAPSTILKKLSASRRPSELARALREVGRLERTRFMVEWYCDPKLRRRCLGGLNKGESAHKLKRAVFFHERGEVRDRSFDSQAFRASGLNLVVSAIVHWNTVYFARVVDSLKGKGTTIPSHLLKHVSPISWEHINLTGTYSWRTEPMDPTSFRSLREEKSFFGLAA